MSQQPVALLVTGSRSLARSLAAETWASRLINLAASDLPPWSVVVHGGATGPDTWAQEAAENHRYGLPLLTHAFLVDGRHIVTTLGRGTLHKHTARWCKSNRDPLARNRHMVEVEMPAFAGRGYTLRVLALVDAASGTRGTDHTVRLARAAGIPVDRHEWQDIRPLGGKS